jgi:hypothetical protein
MVTISVAPALANNNHHHNGFNCCDNDDDVSLVFLNDDIFDNDLDDCCDNDFRFIDFDDDIDCPFWDDHSGLVNWRDCLD